MQLFDLSQLPSSSAGETKRKWNYIMAMLCYRCPGCVCVLTCLLSVRI